MLLPWLTLRHSYSRSSVRLVLERERIEPCGVLVSLMMVGLPHSDALFQFGSWGRVNQLVSLGFKPWVTCSTDCLVRYPVTSGRPTNLNVERRNVCVGPKMDLRVDALEHAHANLEI